MFGFPVGNYVRVKSPGVGKCPTPGPPPNLLMPHPGTDKAHKCSALARGGWAQLELTDA